VLPRPNTQPRAPKPTRSHPRKVATAWARASTLSADRASARASATTSRVSIGAMIDAVALATAFSAGATTMVRSCGASSKQASTPASRQKASRLSIAAMSRGSAFMGCVRDKP
jgi:hypothetical protein